MSIILLTTTLLLSQQCSYDCEITYDEIYEQVMYHTFKTKAPTDKQEQVLLDLIKLEKDWRRATPSFPKSLLGFSIAAAYVESRYNPLAKGDWRTDRRGRKIAKAIGVLQLWPWWEDYYNVNRRDHIQSASAWLAHVSRRHVKIQKKKMCPRNFSAERKWIVAWVQTTRGAPVNKANRFRCFQKPTHYRLLRRWKRQILKRRSEEDGC